MRIGELLRDGTESLCAAGSTSPELDAEVLLAAALSADRSALLREPERWVDAGKESAFRHLVERRAAHEPVAYLTGTKDFYGRTFIVTRDVLIPRPESELLVEKTLELFASQERITLADSGTGSGCLAITFALDKPKWTIIATDISERALAVAKQNATAHGVAERITFLYGDLLEPVNKERLDVVVANLPYVPNDELADNPDLAFEPIIALRGAHIPTKTYGRFVEQWAARNQKPAVLLEIHPNLREFVEQECTHYGATATFIQDLAGRDRVAVLQPSKTPMTQPI